MYLAFRLNQVRLHQRIGRINQTHPIGHERVAIEIRCQRTSGHTPDPVVIFLHRHRLGAFQFEFDLLRVGI